MVYFNKSYKEMLIRFYQMRQKRQAGVPPAAMKMSPISQCQCASGLVGSSTWSSKETGVSSHRPLMWGWLEVAEIECASTKDQTQHRERVFSGDTPYCLLHVPVD